MRLHPLLLTAALGFMPLGAADIFVKADATGANNGSSWANAYTSLQAALAAANSGDVVYIAGGTYKPHATNRDTAFSIKAGVQVYGGYLGTETGTDLTEPLTEARLTRLFNNTNPTILSGDIGTPGDFRDNSKTVVKVVNAGGGWWLDGVTITDSMDGPALLLNNVNTDNGQSPGFVRYCTISNARDDGSTADSALQHGRGVLIQNAYQIYFCGCRFLNNHCYVSGGAAAITNTIHTNSAVAFDGCRMIGNICDSGDGAAITTLNGSTNPITLSIVTSVFANNQTLSTGSQGGAVWAAGPTGSGLAITNSLFYGNSCGTSGNGSAVYTNGLPGSLNFCSLVNNNGGQYAVAGIADPLVSPFVVHVNIFSGNTPADLPTGLMAKDNLFTQAYTPWTLPYVGPYGNNFTESPVLFADVAHPAGVDGIWATGDDGLHLTANSVGYNAADPNEYSTGTTGDVTTRQRPQDFYELGAYEGLMALPSLPRAISAWLMRGQLPMPAEMSVDDQGATPTNGPEEPATVDQLSKTQDHTLGFTPVPHTQQ